MKTREDKDLIYITFFGGFLGLHRFVRKEYGLGILYLLTGGVLGIGYLMDLILEVKNHPNNKNKFYNCISIVLIVIGILLAKLSLLGGLIIIIAGILGFSFIKTKKPFKRIKPYEFFIFLIVILGLVVVLETYPKYLGRFRHCDKNNVCEIVRIDEKYIHMFNGSDYEYEISGFNNKIILKATNSSAEFEYNRLKDTLCYMSGDTCIAEYYKLEE